MSRVQRACERLVAMRAFDIVVIAMILLITYQYQAHLDYG